MTRLRAVLVVVVVLVLGAWTCQVPTDSPGSAGSADVPISTTGLTNLVAGEDWHYVGEAGEPAFENSWVNISGGPKLAFRIREAGVVDIQGYISSGTTRVVFTLPSGYIPTSLVQVPITVRALGSTNTLAGYLGVSETGVVRVAYNSGATPETAFVYAQVFLNPPAVTP